MGIYLIELIAQDPSAASPWIRHLAKMSDDVTFTMVKAESRFPSNEKGKGKREESWVVTYPIYKAPTPLHHPSTRSLFGRVQCPASNAILQQTALIVDGLLRRGSPNDGADGAPELMQGPVRSSVSY